MKILIVFSCLIANSFTLSYPEQMTINKAKERLVTGKIVSAIEEKCESIRDAGLDPLYIEKLHNDFTLPVPVIFSSDAYAKEVSSNGLSNVVILRMSYSVITSRLHFDVEMPLIDFAIGAAATKISAFGKEFDVQASGKIEVQRIRINGIVRVNVGVISGIYVRSVQAAFALGGIKSDLNFVIMGDDYSNEINELISTTMPDILVEHKDEINELIEIIMKEYINARLKDM